MSSIKKMGKLYEEFTLKINSWINFNEGLLTATINPKEKQRLEFTNKIYRYFLKNVTYLIDEVKDFEEYYKALKLIVAPVKNLYSPMKMEHLTLLERSDIAQEACEKYERKLNAIYNEICRKEGL